MNKLNCSYRLLGTIFCIELLILGFIQRIQEVQSLETTELVTTNVTTAASEVYTTEASTTYLEAKNDVVVQVTEPSKEYSYYKIVNIDENNYESTLDLELQDYLYETCKKYGIEDHYELLMAQMYNESRFDTNIISKTNDYGLMQINICNHEWLSEELGVVNFLDPYQSIECGVFMMSDFLSKYSEATALTAYNSGEDKVKNGMSSSEYSDKILRYKTMLVKIQEAK